MNAMNYYELLGLSDKEDDEVKIKKAYRKASMRWHPDRNKAPEATEKFQEIKQAYECLIDPDRRAYYAEHGREKDLDTSPEAVTSMLWESFLKALKDSRQPGFLSRAIGHLEDAIFRIKRKQTEFTADISMLKASRASVTTSEGVENIFHGVIDLAVEERENHLREMAAAIDQINTAISTLNTQYKENGKPASHHGSTVAAVRNRSMLSYLEQTSPRG